MLLWTTLQGTSFDSGGSGAGKETSAGSVLVVHSGDSKQ